MIKLSIFRLEAKSPLQLAGSRPGDYASPGGLPHSDTLFAAICHAWALLGLDEPLAYLEANPDQSPIKLGSAYPFTTVPKSVDPKDGTVPVYFFPRPLVQGKRSDKEPDDRTLNKAIKKLRFMPQDVFEGFLIGEPGDLSAIPPERYKGGFLLPDEKAKLPYEVEELHRVAVPSAEGPDQDSRPYVVSRLRFGKGSGYWFAYQADDQWAEWMRQALGLLQHEGIGTDRNVGFGQFSLHEDKLSLKTPDASEHYTNMGLYLPPSKEALLPTLGNEHTRWQLAKRGGWLCKEGFQTYTKKSVMMITEGSVLSRPSQGCRVDVRPEELPGNKAVGHPVWRSGESVLLPIKIK